MLPGQVALSREIWLWSTSFGVIEVPNFGVLINLRMLGSQ